MGLLRNIALVIAGIIHLLPTRPRPLFPGP